MLYIYNPLGMGLGGFGRGKGALAGSDIGKTRGGFGLGT